MTATEGRGKKAKGVSDGNELIDRLLYALLMVKDVSLTYRSTRSTLLPGFLPTIQAIGGTRLFGRCALPRCGLCLRA